MEKITLGVPSGRSERLRPAVLSIPNRATRRAESTLRHGISPINKNHTSAVRRIFIKKVENWNHPADSGAAACSVGNSSEIRLRNTIE